MEIVICEDYKEISKRAADMIVEEIQYNPAAILGLATGSTPIGLYNELAKEYEDGQIDFSSVTTFNLDEYYKIQQSDPQSYYYFMNKYLFSKINIKPENINIPNGNAEDSTIECMRYHEMMKASNGIDIQVLGIGNNGHIGFNEPANYLESNTHLVSLTEDTINVNARFFDSKEEVPTKALTMGMSEILKAKKILLLISGKGKAKITKEMLNKRITTQVPASFLKLHNNVTVIMDKEAASELDK